MRAQVNLHAIPVRSRTSWVVGHSFSHLLFLSLLVSFFGCVCVCVCACVRVLS